MAGKKSQADVEAEISRAMARLRDALGSGDPRAICESSRFLKGTVDYAYGYPDVWTESLVEDIKQLLVEAKDKTENSPSARKTAARPDRFLYRLESARRARQTLDEALKTRPDASEAETAD